VVSDTGPFAIIPEWVLDHPDLSDKAVRLYGILARYADAQGAAWPRRSVLAERLRASVKTVDRTVAELEKAEAIEVRARIEGRVQRSNLYVLRRARPGGTPVSPPLPTDDAPPGDTGVAQKESQGEREPGETPPSTDVDRERGFEVFWKAYPKRNGKRVGKAATLTRWRSLALDTKHRAYAAALHYATAVEAGDTIAKDPERFLSRGYFEDWVDGPGGTPGKPEGTGPPPREDGSYFAPGTGWIRPVGSAAR